MVAPKVLYGVWIEGQGWLKRDKTDGQPNTVKDRTFAADSMRVAESAAELWGPGATVRPIDGSLIDLEAVFLERRKPKPSRWEHLRYRWARWRGGETLLRWQREYRAR